MSHSRSRPVNRIVGSYVTVQERALKGPLGHKSQSQKSPLTKSLDHKSQPLSVRWKDRYHNRRTSVERTVRPYVTGKQRQLRAHWNISHSHKGPLR